MYCCIATTVYSQENFIKLPVAKLSCPTIIVENDIIANYSVIGNQKEFVDDVSVLKDKPNREENKFYNLTAQGVLFVKLNRQIAVKTQSELADFYGIDLSNGIFVDGYLLESPDYQISSESIIEVQVIKPNPENKLKGNTINVWTLTKEEREQGCAWTKSN